MATITYGCSEAKYKINAGGWFNPLAGGLTPTGWNAGGTNKYQTRYAMDFTAIRSKNATDSIAAARFKFKQSNEYNNLTVYARVTASDYSALADGVSTTSAKNGWASIEFDAGMKAALVGATATYVGTYGAANGTYIEIYGAGADACYLEIDWTPRAPSPTPPSGLVVNVPVTVDSPTFYWNAASDSNGVFTPAQLYYSFWISVDDGANWTLTANQPAQGVTQLTVNFRTFMTPDLAAGQYYFYHLYFRVQTYTPAYGGTQYYSGTTTSGVVTVDYRLGVSIPTSLVVSDSTPYEGETVTFTVNRPATYNTISNNGATNSLAYYVVLPGAAPLANGAAAVTADHKDISYVVGNLTSLMSDLSTFIYARAEDTDGQVSGYVGAGGTWTVRRFRAPAAVITTIDRNETTATVNVLVTDTGYGGAQANSQIVKIQYKLDAAAWADCTLIGWSGLYNSFDFTGLTAGARYVLLIRVVNDAPAGTALSDKTGAEYTGAILEYIPASAAFNDPVLGISGHYAKAMVIGADPLTAGIALDWSGWLYLRETWTYASAVTVTVPTGAIARYTKGMKVRLQQGGGYKYFYIVSVADTTLGLSGGSDFAVATPTAITSISYSNAVSPVGFPQWFNHSPAFPNGWSSNPSGGVYTFTITGTTCIFNIEMPNAGTSNSGYTRVDLPVVAVTRTNCTFWGWARFTDNGTTLAAPGMWAVASAGSLVNFYKDGSGAGSTGSGAKKVQAQLVYEI